MPLPQQVVEQLGHERGAAAHGPASGALLFCGGMLVLVGVLYAGMKFGYEPVLYNQIGALQKQVASANASISAGQEAQLIDFYSQITNLQTILRGHTYASSLLSWLAANTEANVYWQDFELSEGGDLTLKGVAKSESDINQQIAILESSPKITSVVVTSIAPVTQGTGLTFSATLVMDPSVFASTASTSTIQ